MEQTDECIDGCLWSEIVEENHMQVQVCSEQEILCSDEPAHSCASDICSGGTTAASSVLCDAKEPDQSHVQHNITPHFQFVAAVDGDTYVYDSCKSVIRSLPDVLSDSRPFPVEDNFSPGENLTTVTKCEDSNVCNSKSDVQFADKEQRQCDMLNTTFLSCTEDWSARVSVLSLLASRVKALCKVVTAETITDANVVFTMALYSTQMEKKYRHHSLGSNNTGSDLIVAEVCIAFGQGRTTKSAKCSACANAVKLLQKPYLHLEESSPSDDMLRLIGSDKPLAEKSYDIVTHLDITGSDLCSPVLLKQNVKNNKLVVRLKHVISTVRTILYVLHTVKSNRKVIKIAVSVAKVPMQLQIVGGQPFYCNLFIDAALVACAKGVTKKRARENVCTAAVEVFCAPHLRLDGSADDSPIRLVGSDEPFDEVPVHTLPSPECDKGGDLDTQEAQFSADEKLPSCNDQNGVLPAAEDCASVSETERIPDNLLSTADFPAVMACFHRLSNKVKALLKDAGTVRSDATIMEQALKATNLPFQSSVIAVNEGHGYRCDLRIVSVFVTSGEATRRMAARSGAHMNAAQLLQKPHLRLALSRDGSVILVGSDKPFVEVPSALECQQMPETIISSPAIVDPDIDQRAEDSKGHSITLAACAQNSVQSDTGGNEKCPVADICTAEVSVLEEEIQKQNADNSDVLGISSESPYAVSSSRLHNCLPIDVTGDKTDVQTQRMDDSVHEHDLTEHGKTVVIARSDRDLSRLVNRFHSLAHITKDVHAMFARRKSVKDMFLMAVHMSHMCSKVEVVKLGGGRVSCQLLIDDVLVATAKGFCRNSAKITAYCIAGELLRKPYLCLEDKHDVVNVQLHGSDEPFIDMSLKPDGDKMTSSASRGFWPESSTATAEAEDKKDDLHKPLTTLPCGADTSKLVNRFRSLACKLKAMCQSAVKINYSLDVIQQALGGSKMRLRFPVVGVAGVGFRCDVVIGGVEIASGSAFKKKQAKHAACDAAVGLLKKTYLWLQEDPERNQSYKLIGSDQKCVGVPAGILVCDQNCVVDDRGNEVKQPPSSGDSTDCNELHRPDKTSDGGKFKSDMCFEKLAHFSRANGAELADESDLCKTQISSLTYSMDLSELVNQFQALAHRVKCIIKTSTEDRIGFDIVEVALADTQMQKKRLVTWMDSTVCQCELSVDGVVIACGKGDTRERAKETAYSAAAELLNKPYLQLQENKEFRRSYVLVGSDKPFVSGSSDVFPCKQKIVTAERRDGEKHPAGYQSVMMDRNSVSCVDKNELPLQQHSAHSLRDFVILENHFKKKSKAGMQILEQSAAFNGWPLNYELTAVEGGGCHCRLTLGSHTVGDAVEAGKKSARIAGIEQALKRLTSLCYTLQVKDFDVTANALTRNKILCGNKTACEIPSDNIGYKLLTKMGWTGGAVGRNSRENVPQLPPLLDYDDRVGLGAPRPLSFPAIKRTIAEFIQSSGQEDLVFSSELTSEERGIIFAEVRKNHLRSRCYRRGPDVEDVCVVVSMQKSPLEIVKHLLKNGGENYKYRLLEPAEV